MSLFKDLLTAKMCLENLLKLIKLTLAILFILMNVSFTVTCVSLVWEGEHILSARSSVGPPHFEIPSVTYVTH